MKNEFVQSLQRLFSDGRIAVFKLKELKEKNKITEDDYVYITKSQKKKVGD